MTNKFSGLAVLASQARVVTPLATAGAAAQSVQTSLFGRLRKARGGPLAGKIAWMLVRAGQPDHVACVDALNELAEFGPGDLRMFLIACRGARDSLKSAAAAALAGAVVAALEAALAGRGEGGGAVGG